MDALDSLRGEKGESGKTRDTVPDYLELILFTGLRRGEAARLEWSSVDLQNKVFTVTDTKNHLPLTLPMSERVYEIFSRRKDASRGSEFVFPGGGQAGYLQEPKYQTKKITEISSVQFSVHDLRRTFATMAESLNIYGYLLKKLLNHKQGNDVTSGYIVHDVERLRGPMEAIATAILTRAGRKGGADVLPFRKAATSGVDN